MRATFKLINSYFWKTFYGPIISFVFPVLLLAILGNIMRITYVYPGIIALTMLFIGVLALPLAIMELKGSSLFKYIGSSPINKIKFSFVIIAYYIMIAFITGFVVMIATMVMFYKDVFPSAGFKMGIIGGLSTVTGFFSFYIASFIHLILVIAFGLSIATFAKTPQQALTFAIIIIIPSMFLSGMVLTVDIVAKSKAMQWISRFVPFRYSTGNLIVATTPIPHLGDIFSHFGIEEKEIIFGRKDYPVGTSIANQTSPFSVVETVGEHAGSIKPNFNSDLLRSNKSLSQVYREQWFIDWANKYLSAGSVFTPTKGGGLTGKYLTSNREIYDFMKSLQELIKEKTNGAIKIGAKDIFNIFLRTTDQLGEMPRGDWFLMKSLMISKEALQNSDNNIFKLIVPWSVRMIIDTDSLKEFVENYFRGGGVNQSRMKIILDNINKGDFTFIDMFTKQTLELYTIPDRSLNLFAPLLMIGGLGLYINNKFSWSSR